VAADDLDPKAQCRAGIDADAVRVEARGRACQREIQRLANIVRAILDQVIDEHFECHGSIVVRDISEAQQLAFPTGWATDGGEAVDHQVNAADHSAGQPAGLQRFQAERITLGRV
jgi:hypothetical protein